MKRTLTIFWDLDGTLAKWKEDATMDEICIPGYFANVQPEEHLVGLVNTLTKTKECKNYILSHYLPETTAYNDKISWCQKYLPEIRKDHYLFVPCGVDKALFIKDVIKQSLPENYVLVDDYSKNLLSWQQSGGTAIKWMNGVNGRNGTFTGYRIHDVESLAVLIAKI